MPSLNGTLVPYFSNLIIINRLSVNSLKNDDNGGSIRTKMI